MPSPLVHDPPGNSAPPAAASSGNSVPPAAANSGSVRADAALQLVQMSGGAAGAQTTVAKRATKKGCNKRPYKKDDIVKVLFNSVKDMFGQHQSEWFVGVVVKTRVAKDSKQTIDVQFSHDYSLQIDGCPRLEVCKLNGVTSLDSPVFYPTSFGVGDLVDVYFQNQARKLNRGRVVNVSEDGGRVGVVYYEDNYMKGGRVSPAVQMTWCLRGSCSPLP